jgi:hypothetical protein
MTNELKIFANMIINFIDKTLLPILDNKIPEAIKVLDQWSQLKNFVNETENI